MNLTDIIRLNIATASIPLTLAIFKAIPWRVVIGVAMLVLDVAVRSRNGNGASQG